MSIPAHVRALIGRQPMTPVLRIDYRMGPTSEWRTAMVERIVSAPGAPRGISMTLDSAPTRTATLPFFAPSIARPDLVFPAGMSFYDTEGHGTWTTANVHWEHRIWAGWRTPDGVEHLEEMGRYWPSGHQLNVPDGTATLESAESLVIGVHDFNANWSAPGSTMVTWFDTATVLQFVNRQLRAGGDGNKWALSAIQIHAPRITPKGATEYGAGWGTEIWSSIVGVAQAAELRCYPNDQGVFELRRPERLEYKRTPLVTFTEDLIIGRPTHTFDANAFIESIVVEHEWTDINDVKRVVRGTAGWGTAVNRRSIVERRNEPATKAKANAYAEYLMKSHNSAISRWTFDAPMMPWLRPDDAIRIDLNGVARDYFIYSIDFDITQGTMTITTREQM